MPVARKVWQPILARVPSLAAQRWITRPASTRFMAVAVSVPVRTGTRLRPFGSAEIRGPPMHLPMHREEIARWSRLRLI
jgi:hypothetical protein